jgi:hypothetical protein
VKYVDDTTISNVSNNPDDISLQSAVNSAIAWSHNNHMKINAKKTKEMLVSFSRTVPTVPNITVDGMPLERVSSCTLLGIELNDNLNWDHHVDKIYKKAAQRLFFVSQLKRSKMSAHELVKVYISLVRPLLEYAAQLWHPGLNTSQTELLESIQERALRLALPSISYEEALKEANLSTLAERRDELCKRLFIACKEPSHKLHPLLPEVREITHSQRNAYQYHLPRVKTDRFKDTFINYSLFNRW